MPWDRKKYNIKCKNSRVLSLYDLREIIKKSKKKHASYQKLSNSPRARFLSPRCWNTMTMESTIVVTIYTISCAKLVIIVHSMLFNLALTLEPVIIPFIIKGVKYVCVPNVIKGK